jgi:hypothetical protein
LRSRDTEFPITDRHPQRPTRSTYRRQYRAVGRRCWDERYPGGSVVLAAICCCSALSERDAIAAIARTSATRRADELVDAGLWVPNGDGWHVHDFEAMNPQAMRLAVEKQRAKWKQWQDAHRRGEP